MAVVGLTILDRLQLLKALPEKGDFVSIRIVRRMRDALSFTEREIKEWGIDDQKVPGKITWKTGGDVQKRMEFGAKAREIIKAALTAMNAGKMLTAEYMEVVQKFCPELCPPVEEDEVVQAEVLEEKPMTAMDALVGIRGEAPSNGERVESKS